MRVNFRARCVGVHRKAHANCKAQVGHSESRLPPWFCVSFSSSPPVNSLPQSPTSKNNSFVSHGFEISWPVLTSAHLLNLR